MKRKRPKSIE
ncbi:hypothetical protein ID866_13213 [Astraeus odoratus]|nr:hypothetical protein ID866_13213 [Astraeus odoratus]